MKNPNSKVDHLHVAILAFPFGTHAAPLLNLTKKLASNAPHVTFSFFNTSKSNNLIIPNGHQNDHVQKLGNIKVYDVEDGVPQGYLLKGGPLEEIELFMEAAPAALKAAVAAAEAEIGQRVTCMVGDAFLWFVGMMAQEKGVPWVATWPGPQHDLSVHFHTNLIRKTFEVEVQGITEATKGQMLDFIPGMSKIRLEDLPQGIVIGNQDFISKMLHEAGQAITNATAICINSCEELHPTITNDLKSKMPPKLLCVGPFNLLTPSSTNSSLDETNCIGWLDQQEANSVAYVSFGSVARPSPLEIVALAQGLEASGVKFLWSLKDELKVHLPHGFLENNKVKGKIVAWTPQKDVLAHDAVGVFITHFGYNSIIEAIVAQVPMIGRPLMGEQKLNGRFVEAMWGIGIEVEGGVFTKDGVVRSLNQVLRNEEGMKLKENVKALDELIENALSPQGSCHRNFLLLLETITNS